MKVVLLSSKSGHQDILNYGRDLFDTLNNKYQIVSYDNFKSDFSDVTELFDNDEKIVMFNQYAVPEGFETLMKHLPTFKNIKYLLSPYSAYVGLDLNVLKELGIRYRNNAGANAKSVAQYAIACMFCLLSRFPELGKLESMSDGSILGEEYHSKTAGIIGMGSVGKELLNTLNKLGIPTVFYNRTLKEVEANQVSLEEVFENDLVFITIANNPETKNLLSNITSLIKDKNYLIDVSAFDDLYNKKGVVDLLNAGKIKGYALELGSNNKFSSSKNLLQTPHIAWCTIDAEKRTVQNYLNKALFILEGRTGEVDFLV